MGCGRAGAQGLKLADILDAIERVRQHTRVYAIIDTMEYLRRSGRVNALVASAGGLLKIKPIVEVRDGEVSSIARLRTRSRAEQRLQQLTREQRPLDRLAVLHVANRAGAESSSNPFGISRHLIH